MTAVQSLSFSVQPGECFGLLGVNGAGKTTTFRMITGEMSPDYGKVQVNGISMAENPSEARQILGYCPQSDALNVLLTSSEHLRLYARIRGTPEEKIGPLIKDSLNIFGLAGTWASRQAGQLSGGGKRRLNAAIAFAGNPKLVLLDEPTAGLDPAARNQVWTRVRNLAKQGTSLVLTSHSVSECESVCNRLGIMVAGKFCCLGTPQHIKNKFGRGYIVTVRLNSSKNSDSSDQLNKFILNEFPDAKIIEQQLSVLKFRIGENVSCQISSILAVLQKAKVDGLARDYSVTQASLDDVFVEFARIERDKQEQQHIERI